MGVEKHRFKSIGPTEKLVSKKERKRNRQVVGAPEIARPNKRQGAFVRALLLDAPRSARHELKQCFDQLLPYEQQLAFVYAWFFEMLERVERESDKAAHTARGELQTLFLNLKDQLMRIAKRKKDSKAKRWAGRLLAHIYKRIEKHHKKLSKANTSYAKECAKIGSKSVTSALFPHSLVAKVVHRELKLAERYRKRLIMLSVIKKRWEGKRVRFRDSDGKEWEKTMPCAVSVNLKQLAEENDIPTDYLPLVEFPEFSVKWEAKWWKFLWPLIKKNNPSLLSRLQRRSVTGRRGTRWVHYAKEFRQHLHLLARLRSSGVH